MDTLVGNGVNDDLIVYYVGDGYICKHGGQCDRIKYNRRLAQIDDNVSTRLVMESVFPFNIASFGLDNVPSNAQSNNNDYTDNGCDDNNKTTSKLDEVTEVVRIPIDDDIDR